MLKNRIPNYRDLTSLYLNGKTQEEIKKMFCADNTTVNMTIQKRDTRNKVIHFFKVIEGTKKAYIQYSRARFNRAELLSYASKKTLISTTSIMRVLQALEKQGWSLQEATSDNDLPRRYYEEKTKTA